MVSSGGIRDTVVAGNSATSSGGGVYLNEGGQVLNGTIAENQSQSCGGGVYMRSGLLSGVQISNNHGRLQGGGIHVEGLGTVQGCRVEHNRSGQGGGLLLQGLAQGEGFLAKDCMVSGNTADGWGGGAYEFVPATPLPRST
jgi:hypothetical protein